MDDRAESVRRNGVSVGLGVALLMAASQPPVRWTGAVVAKVTGTQPGATHSTRTVIKVSFVEEPAVDGTRLRSVGSRYQMEGTISGRASCHGSADATLTEPVGRSTVDGSGAYRLRLERGFFGWACGKNVLARGARDVVIGTPPDPYARRVEAGRMAGHYVARQETSDSSYEFTVEWEIKKQ